MNSLRPLLLLCLSAVSALGAAQSWPQTRAERTNYRETSHYADVIEFIHGLQRMGAPISLQYVGESTLGKKMPLVIASRPPVVNLADAKRSGKPIVYVQANIHAGEVEGKEAALHILRRLSQEPRGVLDKIVLLVTPIYNIDGNEKFAPQEKNRPGQNGPAMVGERANGQGFDLNRDCIKAESPEMRAILSHIYNAWDPDVVMDLHTTNGTRHGYPLTYSVPLNPNTDPEVFKFSRDSLIASVRKELISKYKLYTFDYGNATRRDNKTSWYTFGSEGRYVTNYAGLRNRIAILSEAMVYEPFDKRVLDTDRFTTAVLEYVARNDKKVVELTRKADERVKSWGLNPATAPALGVRFDFASRGFEDVLIEKPAPEGAPPRRGPIRDYAPVRMEVFGHFKSTKTSKFPAAYIIPASEKKTLDLLRTHGVIVEELLESWQGSVEQFTIERVATDANPFQGHRLNRIDGAFSATQANVASGSFIVKTAQPLGVLAFMLLEP